MVKIFLCFLIFPFVIFAQQNEKDSLFYQTKTQPANFFLPIKQKQTNTNSLTELENAITSSVFVQGYKYNIKLNTINQFIEIPKINHLLPLQNFSFLNTNIINSYHTDFNLKGSVNLNGITNLMTLKGKLNKYDGNYFLQVSYHIPTNNTDYVSKLINERYQRGLALVFKMNLERAHQKK